MKDQMKILFIINLVLCVGIIIATFYVTSQLKTTSISSYTIYAVDEDGVQQVDNFVVVPNGSITCPNDVKLQRPRYVFVEAEK